MSTHTSQSNSTVKRKSLFTLSLVGIMCALGSSCTDSSREANQKPRPTALTANCNTIEKVNRVGQTGDGVRQSILWATNDQAISNTPFEYAEEDTADPLVKKLNDTVDLLAQIGSIPPDRVNEKALAVAKARSDFEEIYQKSTNERLRLLASLNVVTADISLGDREAFAKNASRLPKIRDRTSGASIAADLVGLSIGSDAVAQDMIMARHENLKCNFRASGIISPPTIVNPVNKVVKQEELPRFTFTEGSTSTLKFPSLEVELLSVLGNDRGSYEERYNSLTLLLKAKNTSQRVMNVSKMAILLTHNGRTQTYRTVDAEYRLLPGETASVNFASEKSGWRKILSDRSETVSSCVIYDVPVQVDDLGNVTKKENLTWKFTFDPGSPAVTEIDPDKSVWSWTVLTRGIDHLKSTK